MNLDKVLIALFVALLLTGQAEAFLGDSGLGWAYLLLLATGAAYVATPAVAWLAHRLGVLDVPRGRKAHAAPTALMGGVAVYIAFALTVVRNFSFSEELKGIALGGSLVLAVGLADDWRELPARLKLGVQLLAVAVLVHHGVVVTFLPEDTWGIWGTAGEWFITAFWVIGITNAVNFLDGLDGLASGISAVIAAFFSLIALQNGQTYMAYLALALAGACIGFLPYNMRPGAGRR